MIPEVRDLMTMTLAFMNAGTLLYTWLTSRSKANSEQIVTLQKRVEDTEGELKLIKAEIKHLPSAAAIHKLELAMEKLEGEMDVLAEKLKPIGAVGDRIQELLLSKAFQE